VIENATYPSQKTVLGSLKTIAEKAKSLSPPGTIVIGELAAKSEALAWFQSERNRSNTAFDNNQCRTKFAG
jgi:uroporphyrin-III C-methyltransferase